MAERPQPTPLYHISHYTNLRSVLDAGGLLPDVEMINRGGPETAVGMNTIKQARLTRPVKCHPGAYVGEYVPFFFCPRSVMLYILHRGNHPELTYDGGQEPIIHLQADLDRVIGWANREDLPWAFTTGNARAGYARFLDNVAQLDQLNWDAVESDDFRDPTIKEGKQAEFLVHRFVPWTLVESIGVRSGELKRVVEEILLGADHAPPVRVQPRWYF